MSINKFSQEKELEKALKFLENYEDELEDVEESLEELTEENGEGQDLYNFISSEIEPDLEEPDLDEPDLEDYEAPTAERREKIPGSEAYMEDLEDEEEKKLDLKYEDDPTPSKFHEFLARKYQNIPQHDGNTVPGCTRAMYYLIDLDKKIVENIKNDQEHVLDISTMHQYQEKILRDILLLKKRIKSLKDKVKDDLKELEKKSYMQDTMVKEAAGTMKIYLSVSPFIKSICGILINSTVSAGKPFELVYEYLKEKYEITPREELEILEVLKDMGQPIFKDRGSMPGEKTSKELEEMEQELGGVDFITNYFA